MIRIVFVCVLSALAAACANLVAPLVTPQADTQVEALRAGAYKLDPDHAALFFRIDHLGFSTFIGRFERLEASLDFNAEDPAASRIDAIVDMTSLDIANDEFGETLKGPNWFDADRFPQARFVSTEIIVTGENTGRIKGDLTLHGVTAPIELAARFNGAARDRLRGNAYVVGFSAKGEIDRTQFGVDRFASVLAKTVEIEIEAEFIRQ